MAAAGAAAAPGFSVGAKAGSSAGPGSPDPGSANAPEEELPPLEPGEVGSRLERSARQFRNRRKVLIRGLPADVASQEVHDLLNDYELKYCFVDKYKGTVAHIGPCLKWLWLMTSVGKLGAKGCKAL